jgi:hypothetical protein
MNNKIIFNSKKTAAENESAELESLGLDPTSFSTFRPESEIPSQVEDDFEEKEKEKNQKAFTNNPETAKKYPDLYEYDPEIAQRSNKQYLSRLKALVKIKDIKALGDINTPELKNELNRLYQQADLTPEQEIRLKIVHDNAEGINEIKAHLIMVDRTARNTEAYKCPVCNGKKGGGTSLPEAGEDREICPGCNNYGYIVENPHMHDFLYNIKNNALRINACIDFHNKVCTTNRCHSECMFKDQIDQIRYKSQNPKKLRKRDTHVRPGSGDFIKQLLRPVVVKDEISEIAPQVLKAGNREDEPFVRGDMIHVINYDTHPIARGYSPKNPFIPDFADVETKKPVEQSGYDPVSFNPSWIPNAPYFDNQITGYVLRTNRKGTKAHVLVRVRPDSLISEDRKERKKGKDRSLQSLNYDDAIDHSLPKDESMAEQLKSRIDTRQKNKGRSLTDEEKKNEKEDYFNEVNERQDFRDHVSNLMKRVQGRMGDRSPVSYQKSYWKVLKGVSTSQLARVSPMTLPFITQTGITIENVPETEIKGGYDYPLADKKKKVYRSRPPLRNITIGEDEPTSAPNVKKISAVVVHRGDHAFSRQAIMDSQSKTTSPTIRKQAKTLFQYINKINGIEDDHPDSLLYQPKGTITSIQSKPRKSRTKAVPDAAAFSLQQKINNLEEDKQHEVETPPTIDSLLSSEGGYRELLDMIHENIRKTTGNSNFTLSPEQTNNAVRHLKETGDVNQTIRNLGFTPEDDQYNS